MTKITPQSLIRKASDKDAAIVAVLGTVTFFEAYFEQDDTHDLANHFAETFQIAAVRQEIADPNASFYLAFQDHHAVGYAKLLRGTPGPGVAGKSPIELKRIYLVERVWRTGVGEQLLRHCEYEAASAGHDAIWLGVWQENTRGLRFYAKHGYRKVGTIQFPYGASIGTNDVMYKKIAAPETSAP
ncbi:MAG: GNAT family N-acetyltransferase [Acidobacteriota bacterium]|nr:MAG: GNAT family N-acetyltransferase [Acidobacteriota bacterium]